MWLVVGFVVWLVVFMAIIWFGVSCVGFVVWLVVFMMYIWFGVCIVVTLDDLRVILFC